MSWSTASLWTSIAFGITGAEFFGMMGAEIRSPERRVKPAIWLATAFVVIFYAATTLALIGYYQMRSDASIHAGTPLMLHW
jgi:amino acid transporter